MSFKRLIIFPFEYLPEYKLKQQRQRSRLNDLFYRLNDISRLNEIFVVLFAILILLFQFLF